MSGLLDKIYEDKWILLGIALVLLLLWIMWPFLDVFVYAIFVYYITRPIKQWMSRYIKNDALLVLASLLLLALPLILLISYTMLIGLSQLMALVSSQGLGSAIPASQLANVTSAFNAVQQNLSSGTLNLSSLSDITRQEWFHTISGYSSALQFLQAIVFSAGGTIVGILFRLLIVFLIAFYLLKDDRRMADWFHRTFPALQKEHNGLFVRFSQGVDSDLQKIFFGNLISIVFFAIIAVIAYFLLNTFAPPSLQIPSPVLLGILTGASALVPLIGMWLVVGPLLVYLIINCLLAGTLLSSLGYLLFMVLFIFVFVMTLPTFFIQPLVARCKVPMGLLMFGYIFGPLVFGVSGLFLGAIVLVLLTNYFLIVAPELSGSEGPEKQD